MKTELRAILATCIGCVILILLLVHVNNEKFDEMENYYKGEIKYLKSEINNRDSVNNYNKGLIESYKEFKTKNKQYVKNNN